MPYTTEWVSPEVAVDYKGVKVYHIYKDDDINQGTRAYHFTTCELCGDDGGCGEESPNRSHAFDIYDLPGGRELVASQPPYMDTKDSKARAAKKSKAWDEYHRREPLVIKEIIKKAIDEGLLKQEGLWKEESKG